VKNVIHDRRRNAFVLSLEEHTCAVRVNPRKIRRTLTAAAYTFDKHHNGPRAHDATKPWRWLVITSETNLSVSLVQTTIIFSGWFMPSVTSRQRPRLLGPP
jgi:hypothetical protein